MPDLMELLQARKAVIAHRQQELGGALHEYHALQEELRALEALLRLYGSRAAAAAACPEPHPAPPLDTGPVAITGPTSVPQHLRALFAEENAPQRVKALHHCLTSRGVHVTLDAVMKALKRNPRDFERIKRGRWRGRQIGQKEGVAERRSHASAS